MKNLIHRSATPFGALIVAMLFVMVAVAIILSAVTRADDGQQLHRGRLITIYDRGTQKVILSEAPTIGDAVKEAGIKLDSRDTVEPAVNEKLVAPDYKVNIYRARPVIVVDGSTRQRVITPYQTAQQIAQDAGVTLYPEDHTSLDRVTNLAEGAGLQLTIDRATPVTFVLYGKSMTVRTHAATVGDMLKEKGVRLAADDTLSVAISQPIVSGQIIELWRNGVQTVNIDEDIPFDTQQIRDADQPVGYKTIQTAGVNGKRTVSYQIEMKNGQEISRQEIQSVTTSEPKQQIEIIGTKVNLPPGSHQDWMAAAGISSSDYGYVEYIVSREGGWCSVRWQGDRGCENHGYAPSGLGYGVVQATPGIKMASAGDDWLTNPITQLRWATGYAVARYGSWAAAYNYWTIHHNW